MQEEWLPVVGYSGRYAVSSLGQVYSEISSRVLSPGLATMGYLTVFLVDSRGKKKSAYVHRLVLLAFRGDPPKGFVANHRDGNKTNNRLANLEWVSRTENISHAYRIGLRAPQDMHGARGPNAKLTQEEVLEIRAKAAQTSYAALSRAYGVSESAISGVVSRRTWKYV